MSQPDLLFTRTIVERAEALSVLSGPLDLKCHFFRLETLLSKSLKDRNGGRNAIKKILAVKPRYYFF